MLSCENFAKQSELLDDARRVFLVAWWHTCESLQPKEAAAECLAMASAMGQLYCLLQVEASGQGRLPL